VSGNSGISCDRPVETEDTDLLDQSRGGNSSSRILGFRIYGILQTFLPKDTMSTKHLSPQEKEILKKEFQYAKKPEVTLSQIKPKQASSLHKN